LVDLFVCGFMMMSVEIKGVKIGLEKLELEKVFALAI